MVTHKYITLCQNSLDELFAATLLVFFSSSPRLHLPPFFFVLLIPFCNFSSSVLFCSYFCDFHLFSPVYFLRNFFHSFLYSRHKETYIGWQPRQDNTGESNWVSERSHDVSWCDLNLAFVTISQLALFDHLYILTLSCEFSFIIMSLDHHAYSNCSNWPLFSKDSAIIEAV